MNRLSIIISIITGLFYIFPLQVISSENKAVGNIKTLAGDVSIIREVTTVTPVPGAELFNKDVIKTGSNGTVGVRLRDDTIFTLGHDSELNLDKFYFNSSEKKYSLIMRMVKGTFVFVSGIISRLSPESVELLTPDGSIAIRGTKLAIQVKGEN